MAKLTRRTLALVSLGATAAAQTPPQPPTAEEDLPAARKQVVRNAEALAKFDLPMSTEPAFVFKA